MYFLFNEKLLYSIIILSFIASIIAYPFCPAEIPIHFDAWNSPDVVTNKTIGLFVVPAVMLILQFIRKNNIGASFGIYLLLACHIYLLYVALNY